MATSTRPALQVAIRSAWPRLASERGHPPSKFSRARLRHGAARTACGGRRTRARKAPPEIHPRGARTVLGAESASTTACELRGRRGAHRAPVAREAIPSHRLARLSNVMLRVFPAHERPQPETPPRPRPQGHGELRRSRVLRRYIARTSARPSGPGPGRADIARLARNIPIEAVVPSRRAQARMGREKSIAFAREARPRAGVF
jgi:hypothetical protein